MATFLSKKSNMQTIKKCRIEVNKLINSEQKTKFKELEN